MHIDLSGAATGGARTNFDESPFGGMPKRDFVYLQHRGAAAPRTGRPPLWQRVDGTTQGWTLSVAFDVPPGETRLGLSPPTTTPPTWPTSTPSPSTPASGAACSV